MNQFQHGILFYHEKAGQGDVYEILGNVTQHLSKLCQQLTIYKSGEEGDIIKYCHTIKEQSFDVIFLLGGDGTVHELINGVMQADLNLPIGILPGGTFNDFTKSLNLPLDPAEAAASMLDANVKHIDVMKAGDRYVLNFIGLGLIVENAESIEETSKGILGKLSYVMPTIRTVSNPTFFNYRLTIDGERFTGESSMIVVSNGHYVGASKIPLVELSPDDGQMEVFIFKDSGLKLFSELLSEKSAADWNEVSSNIEHHSARSILLETDEPMEVDVDGEIDLKTPLDIDILTKRLRMFALSEPHLL